MSTSRPHRRLSQSFGATMLLAIVLTATALPAAAATASIKFGVDIGDVAGCITISATAGQSHLVWRDVNGALKAEATNVSTNGLWFFCPGNFAVAIGDRLKVTDEISTRTFIVPNLTLHQNRVTDTYSGTGPASRTVRLEVPQGDVAYLKSIRVDPDGNWSFHRDDMEIFGRWYASLSWRSPHGDQVRASNVAPYLVVTLNRAGFSGSTAPNQVVEVELEDGVDAMGSATASTNGAFTGKFRDGAGHLRPAAPGDHLMAPSLASDANWIVPEIEGTADPATDIVEGRCEVTATFVGIGVEVYRTGHLRGYGGPDWQPDGSFVIDMQEVGDFYADPANIKHGDQIVINCGQITGDRARLTFIVP